MSLISLYDRLYIEHRKLLTDKQLRVWYMSELDGMSGKEIANKLGISQAVASRHLTRAKEKIRDKMREWRKERKKMVYICSPLRGDYEANTEKAIEYCRKVASWGETPIAPHIYCTRFLDDTNEADRQRGFEMAMELLKLCDCVLVFGDHISEGMRLEIDKATEIGIPVRYVQG